MNHYLIDFELPHELTDEFMSLIPKHRAHIDEMMETGVVLSYALSSDRTKVWATLNATSKEEVQEIIKTMPLNHMMRSTVYELAFYLATGNGLPAISLN